MPATSHPAKSVANYDRRTAHPMPGGLLVPTAPDARAHADDLADFVAASPSSFHTAAEVAARLEPAGFTRLDEA
jgi:hypothetical protein